MYLKHNSSSSLTSSSGSTETGERGRNGDRASKEKCYCTWCLVSHEDSDVLLSWYRGGQTEKCIYTCTVKFF